MTDKAISALRQRLIDDVAIRRLGLKTQHDYIRRVKSFADFVGHSPDKTTSEDIHRYQMRLASIGGFVPAHPGAAALSQSEVVLRPGFPRTIFGTLSVPITFEEPRSVAQRSGARDAATADDVTIFLSRARTTGGRVELAWWPRRPHARFRGTGSAESSRCASGGAE
jgi:hypothetical protein